MYSLRSSSGIAAASVAVAAALGLSALPFGAGSALGGEPGTGVVASASGVALADAPGELPTLYAVLSRYVAVVGGRDAILNLRTRTATLRCVTDLTSRSTPVYEVDSLAVWSTADGKFLAIHRTPGSVMIEGCDGDRTWKIEDGNVRAFGFSWGPRDMWLTDPRFPLRLTELFPDMKPVGLRTLGGELLYVVDIDGDESHRLGFDVETGLLTRLGYNRELRDYTEVDGVLMPMRVVESRKGGSSTFYFDTVRHNNEMHERIFALAR